MVQVGHLLVQTLVAVADQQPPHQQVFDDLQAFEQLGIGQLPFGVVFIEVEQVGVDHRNAQLVDGRQVNAGKAVGFLAGIEVAAVKAVQAVDLLQVIEGLRLLAARADLGCGHDLFAYGGVNFLDFYHLAPPRFKVPDVLGQVLAQAFLHRVPVLLEHLLVIVRVDAHQQVVFDQLGFRQGQALRVDALKYFVGVLVRIKNNRNEGHAPDQGVFELFDLLGVGVGFAQHAVEPDERPRNARGALLGQLQVQHLDIGFTVVGAREQLVAVGAGLALVDEVVFEEFLGQVGVAQPHVAADGVEQHTQGGNALLAVDEHELGHARRVGAEGQGDEWPQEVLLAFLAFFGEGHQVVPELPPVFGIPGVVPLEKGNRILFLPLEKVFEIGYIGTHAGGCLGLGWESACSGR